MHNSNELCLFISRAFSVEKNQRVDKLPSICMNSKENSTALNSGVDFFNTNHHIIQTDVLASFHAVLFKSRNYVLYTGHIS